MILVLLSKRWFHISTHITTATGVETGRRILKSAEKVRRAIFCSARGESRVSWALSEQTSSRCFK